MKRSYGALALLSIVALLPGIAEARGYGRYGSYVNTPFGKMPMSAMQQAGGNPFVAQQMYQMQMQMKMQQQMMKAQQQYQQQMKKMGQNAKGTGNSQLNSFQKFQPAPTTHAKKKKTTHKTTSASKKATATTPTTTGNTATK